MTLDANGVAREKGIDALRMVADGARPFRDSDPRPRLITAASYSWRPPAGIDPRPWIYGRILMRGIVSVTVAPGGVGKTSLLIAETLAMVSGRSLLNERVHGGSRRVWLLNLEEPEDELARRIQAAALHHGISAGDVSHRLFVNAGPDNALMTASAKADGYVHEDMFVQLEHEIRQRGIDVLVLDPFVSSHALDENDNVQIDRVVKRWSRLAQATNCAVHIIHHTRKSDTTTVSDSARGAKALVDAARIVRVLNPATDEDLAAMGLQPDVRAFHARRDKQNLAAGHEERSWYTVRSVSLENGPPADDVGVVAAISVASIAKTDLSPETIRTIQEALKGKDYGYHQNAGDWAGIAIAPILKLNPADGADRTRIRHRLGDLLKRDYLVCAKVRDTRAGRDRNVVRIGTLVLPPQPQDDGVEGCGGVEA